MFKEKSDLFLHTLLCRQPLSPQYRILIRIHKPQIPQLNLYILIIRHFLIKFSDSPILLENPDFLTGWGYQKMLLRISIPTG